METDKKTNHYRKSFKLSLAKSITSLFSSPSIKTPTNEESSDSITNYSQDTDVSTPSNNLQLPPIAPRRTTFPDASKNSNISDSFSHISSSKSVDLEFESNIRALIGETEKKENLPILLPSEINDYIFDGYGKYYPTKMHQQDFGEENDVDYSIYDEEIIETNKAYSHYSKHFYEKEHFNFIGIYDNAQTQSNYFVLSVKYVNENKFQCIFRTKEGNKYEEIELKDLFEKETNDHLDLDRVHIHLIVKHMNQNAIIHEVRPVYHPMTSSLIKSYDKDLAKSTFTFGIIYQKFGQVNEKEIFGNTENSKEFDEFLNFIGRRVSLKNFSGFRGMLDTNNDDTGKESVYEQHDDSEIMFHVSTLLPYSDKDHQNVERKRHIGNDRVAIVFQDQDTPFSPRMIKSKLLHVFLVIQPVKINGETQRYKVSVISKKDVFYFEPTIRKPFIFNKDQNLKRFLLSKLINAEYASLRAPAFSSFSEQTIKPALFKLCSRLNMLSYNFTWIGSPNSYNYIYSMSGMRIIESEYGFNDSTATAFSQVSKYLPKPVKGAFRRLSVSIKDPHLLAPSREDDNNDREEVSKSFKKGMKKYLRAQMPTNLDTLSDNLSLSPSVEAPSISNEELYEKSQCLSLPHYEESRSMSLQNSNDDKTKDESDSCSADKNISNECISIKSTKPDNNQIEDDKDKVHKPAITIQLNKNKFN